MPISIPIIESIALYSIHVVHQKVDHVRVISTELGEISVGSLCAIMIAIILNYSRDSGKTCIGWTNLRVISCSDTRWVYRQIYWVLSLKWSQHLIQNLLLSRLSHDIIYLPYITSYCIICMIKFKIILFLLPKITLCFYFLMILEVIIFYYKSHISFLIFILFLNYSHIFRRQPILNLHHILLLLIILV